MIIEITDGDEAARLVGAGNGEPMLVGVQRSIWNTGLESPDDRAAVGCVHVDGRRDFEPKLVRHWRSSSDATSRVLRPIAVVYRQVRARDVPISVGSRHEDRIRKEATDGVIARGSAP